MAMQATGQLALASAVALVLALSWEFATPGESLTNGHRPRFPRDSRVMLFLGYVVITATTSVFFSGIGELDGSRWVLSESQFEAENWVRDGLMFLGGPLVITIGILGINRWRQERAAAEAVETNCAGRRRRRGPAPRSATRAGRNRRCPRARRGPPTGR